MRRTLPLLLAFLLTTPGCASMWAGQPSPVELTVHNAPAEDVHVTVHDQTQPYTWTLDGQSHVLVPLDRTHTYTITVARGNGQPQPVPLRRTVHPAVWLNAVPLAVGTALAIMTASMATSPTDIPSDVKLGNGLDFGKPLYYTYSALLVAGGAIGFVLDFNNGPAWTFTPNPLDVTLPPPPQEPAR